MIISISKLKYIDKLLMMLLIWLLSYPSFIYATPTLKIVATTSIIGDALQNIVGCKAQIIKLMGPGMDPHSYKATPKNVQDLSHADIIFYNGLHLEGKMADVLANFSKRKPVYAASNGINPSQYLGDLKSLDAIDPHIWFDISLWKQAVIYMSTQLQHIDPPAAVYYQENTEKYIQVLENLHEEIKKLVQKIPRNQRVLITSHDAFSYFGRAYDIQVKGLQGISTVGECGLRDIINLVDFIIRRKVKAVFPENSVPNKPLRAVIKGCQEKKHIVALGAELYSDALGEEGTLEGTYIGMMMSNVTTIVKALQ